MGVIRYDIQEEGFSPEKRSQYELSILSGVDSSSYLVVDKTSAVQRVRAIQHHRPQEAWWTEDNALATGYAKIKLGWLSPQFTLLPNRLYNAEKRRTYLTRLTELSKEATVMADVLPSLDVVLVYAIDQNQLTTWRQMMVGARFYHAITPILEQLSHISKRTGLPHVFAYQRDKTLITIAIERGQVVFCNAFTCQAANDVLYYILLTYEQCQWEPQHVALRLFGELTTDAEIYKLCYRYIRDIDFLSTADMVSWGQQSTQHPDHLFFDLAALHQYQ